MIIIYLALIFTVSSYAMQTAAVSAHKESIPSAQLAKHAHEIEVIRSSLWQIKGLLVSYQSHRTAFDTNIKDQNTLDCHNNNIKDTYQQVIIECDKACEALSRRDLQPLIYHTSMAHHFFAHLNAEATHFQNMVAKRFPHSNM